MPQTPNPPVINFIGMINSKMEGTRIIPLEGQIPLPIEAGGAETEHTFKGKGFLLGEGLIQTFTSKSVFHRGESAFPSLSNPFANVGFYESQNNGLLIRINDGERITWTGHGMGVHFDPLPRSKHRAMRFYRTASDKLKKFNGLIAIVEIAIDENGYAEENHWQVMPS
jgi:hypothetical protein